MTGPRCRTQITCAAPSPGRTYSAFADDKSFCHWEAPTKEAVVEVFKKYEIPYEAIHEVRRFDPATGEMEPVPMEKEGPQLA